MLLPIDTRDFYSGGPETLGALLSAIGAGGIAMIYLTTNQTLLQLSIPDALRGRVTGIVTLNAGLMPVGALIVGVGADLVGPRTMTILLASSAALIAVGVFIFSSTIRDYRLSEAMAAQ